MQRLILYGRLVRIDKPIGILLLLWPTLWALFVSAQGWPSVKLLFIFVLGTVLMRSAGCAMNDYFDRDVDLHVQRTQHRVLTAGLIKPKEALWVAAILGLLSLGLVWSLNRLTLQLAVVAAVLAVTYPLFKRFFAIPQAYLGIAFGFGIPMGFAATSGAVPLVAWILLLANVFWAIAYDTEYAMVDRDDDRRLNLKTSALTFGRYDVLCVAFCYLMTFLLLGLVGYLLDYGRPYVFGLLVGASLSTIHVYWIRNRDRDACFRAFLHNTWVGCAIFAGIFLETIVFS